MLFVEYCEAKGIFCLSVVGHAETAPKGKDLVCAAASVLAYTAAYCLEVLNKDDKLDGEIHISLKPGDCLLLCKAKPEHLMEVRTMLRAVLYGFVLLQRSFPEAIAVHMENENQ